MITFVLLVLGYVLIVFIAKHILGLILLFVFVVCIIMFALWWPFIARSSFIVCSGAQVLCVCVMNNLSPGTHVHCTDYNISCSQLVWVCVLLILTWQLSWLSEVFNLSLNLWKLMQVPVKQDWDPWFWDGFLQLCELYIVCNASLVTDHGSLITDYSLWFTSVVTDHSQWLISLVMDHWSRIIAGRFTRAVDWPVIHKWENTTTQNAWKVPKTANFKLDSTKRHAIFLGISCFQVTDCYFTSKH